MPTSLCADGGVDAALDLTQTPSAADVLGYHGLLVALDHAEGDTLYVYDLTSGELRQLSDEIACRGAKISPDGTRVVYHQGGMLRRRALAGGPSEALVAGYDGHWWLDDAGEEWIYYTTMGDDPKDVWRRVLWPQGLGITTRRRRLRDGRDEHVLDWKASGGPSPDGTHLAGGYATVVVFDAAQEPHFLNGGEQGCNTSLSPDERYLLMFFPDLAHQRIAMVNIQDQLLWELSVPFGVVRWENPDWSNHPRFAVTSGLAGHGYASVYVVALPVVLDGSPPQEQDLVQLLDARQGNHDWREPTLWVDWRHPPTISPSADSGAPEVPRSNSNGCRLVGETMGASPLLTLLLALIVWRRRRV
ncbi:MAG: hypothetical protein JRH20_04245 [Deltaproteobacteria bacterium]|nr:hypothetical protein [Deltaproteobacteria bacterium]